MSESNITKRALADAMKTLMAEQPLSKITVGDVCERCGMSRKGFYYHFKDKYDLVNWVFYEEFIASVLNRTYVSPWEFFDDICLYFYENRAFYINAFQVEGQNSFVEYFSVFMQSVVVHYLDACFKGNEHDDFYTAFFTDAFRVAIIKWLRENAQIDPTAFVGLLRGAVDGLAQHARNNPLPAE
ncbi:MAG: TetR/AcrR family transcriptional regulator C-terminal domain-containing protein [Clostridia bacterium]